MLMKIQGKEDTKSNAHVGQALECNRLFYAAAKALGLNPTLIHIDKDWAKINAAKVVGPLPLFLKGFNKPFTTWF